MTTIDNYQLLNTLGQGAFSKVKLVKDEEGKKFAMKIMKSDSKKSKDQENNIFLNEVKVMKELDHPNILKLIDSKSKAEAIRADGSKLKLKYMTLEYAEGGELFDYIAETGRFSEDQARYFFKQIISALEYMHKKGYKHRDIKPENVLFDKDYNIKIGDFGFVTKDDISYSRKGTYGYMAPEVLAGEPYRGEEADLFAAAVILFILVTQHPPFIRAEETDRFYKAIANEKWEKFWDVHSDLPLSKNFINFFSKMINQDPSDRMTLSEIKAHKWFKGPVPSSDEIFADFYQRHKILKKKSKGKENKSPEKPKASKKTKMPVKYTKFFKIEDPEVLIDLVVKFAKDSKIDYEKSKEFFRVELKYQESGSETNVLVNVLKKPENSMRCLELVHTNFKSTGDKKAFESLFTQFKVYANKRVD